MKPRIFSLPTPLPTPTPTPDPDEALAGAKIGRFLVLRKLGEGGMGVVYAAYDAHLDRTVALKLLGGQREGNDAESLARFEREARALAQLSHPNVVQVHDVGLHAGGMFIAMEYVHGVTLQRWLETPRSWQAIVATLVQAGRGLEAAHQAKLVHRDFKPGNVMIGDDGRVRVLDFGLVHGVGEADERLTSRDSHPGTPAYMAPEQIEGREVDPLTDQFAFCMVAFEALYGTLPFGTGPLLARATRMMMGKIQPRPARTKVPRRIDEVLRRGLAVTPDRRWPSLTTLLRELELCLDHRRRVLRGVVVVCGVVMLGSLGLLAHAKWEQDQLEQDKERLMKAHSEALERELCRKERVTIELMAQTPGKQIEAIQAALLLRRKPHDPATVLDVEAGLLAATRELRGAIELRHPSVVDVAFDPAQPRIATGSQDGRVAVWDARSGVLLGAWLDHPGLSALAFSPDGRWLLTIGGGRAVVWSLASAHPRWTFTVPDVEVAEFSPDSRRIVSGGRDGYLRVHAIDPAGRVDEVAKVLVGETIRGLSSDTTRVVTHDDWGGVQVIELEGSGAKIEPTPTGVGEGRVFVEPGTVATIDALDTVRVWDVDTWQTRVTLGEHPLGVLDVELSPRRDRIVTISADSVVRVWDAHSGRRVATLEGQPGLHARVRFSPTGDRVAVVSSDGRVVVWTLARAVEDQRIDPGERTITAMAATPDSSFVVMGSRDRAILVDGSGKRIADTGDSIAPDAYVDAVDVSTDGRAWATGDSSGQVLKGSTHGGAPPRRVTVGERPITRVALSTHAGLLAVGDEGGQVEIWRGAERVCSLGREHEGRIVALEFSPDERWLSIATKRSVEVLALATCSVDPRHRLELGPSQFPMALAFAPDGEQLVVGGKGLGSGLGSGILVWSLGTGQQIELASSDTVVHGVAFSPDGSRLFSAGDRQLLVWDRATWREITDLGATTRRPVVLGFTPEGDLDLGYADGRVVRTRLGLPHRVALACASLRAIGGPEADLDGC